MPAICRWTTQAIIEAVQAFIIRNHRAPQRPDFTASQGLPSIRVVERRMGTWQEPVRLAAKEKT